jgi:RNA recognition motif-containing protein
MVLWANVIYSKFYPLTSRKHNLQPFPYLSFMLCYEAYHILVVVTMSLTVRKAGGKVWEDASLAEWPESDYRIFVGNLGNEVSDEMLSSTFKVYKSFQRARVVRDKRTMKTRGYGFVSFSDPMDMLSALRDLNNKYIGNRPCTLKRSKWEDRSADQTKSKPTSGDSGSQSSTLPSRSVQKFKRYKSSH